MASVLAESLYQNLLEDLLKGTLQPGTLLNRRQLASNYGVSLSPVTETITRLEMEGFVETIPRKGTQIRTVTRERIRDTFILRDAIETKSARLYWGEPLKEHADELMEMAGEVDNAPEDLLRDWKTEIAFHQRLIELSGSLLLAETFARVVKLNLFYGMNQIIPIDLQKKRDNHIRLVSNLLDAESSDTAETLIRNHVWYGKHYLLDSPQI